MVGSGFCAAGRAQSVMLSWLLVPVVVFAIYFRSITFPFINYDDFSYINPVVQSGLNWDSIQFALTSRFSYYSPVTWLSYIIECTLFSPVDATIFRFTNIWLHAVNCMLLLHILRILFPNWRFNFFVVLLFALHPVQVESVVWVSERKGLLAALFTLLCIKDYIAAAKAENLWNRFLIGRIGLFYILSILSKPTLICLPLLLAAVRHLIIEGGAKKKEAGIKPYIPLDFMLFGLAVGLLIIQIVLQRGTLEEGFLHRLHPSTCIGSYLVYFLKIVFPMDLMIPYQRYVWSVEQALIPGVLIVGFTVILICISRRNPMALLGWIWFLVLLFPGTGIIPLGVHGLANRYLYLPSIGIFILVASLIDRMLLARIGVLAFWRIAVSPALFAVLIWATYFECSFWKDTETLFGKTLRLDPHNQVARQILYNEYIRQDWLSKAQHLVVLQPIEKDIYSLSPWNVYFPSCFNRN